MANFNLVSFAHNAMDEMSFQITEKLWDASYYQFSPRSLVFKGEYKGKIAVFKAYDDPRISNEISNIFAFQKMYKGKKLFSPTIYESKEVSVHRGWFIMEYITSDSPFQTPLKEQKKSFLATYKIYKKEFPKAAFRPLLVHERLPADEFHFFRVHRWMELANKKLVSQLPHKEFFDLSFWQVYRQVIHRLSEIFHDKALEWCFGHFKPDQVYLKDNKIFLIDWAHARMYPKGYEEAFIIWQDAVMNQDWTLDESVFIESIIKWIDLCEESLDLERSLICASLLERFLGTIFADICATDLSIEEKHKRVNRLILGIKVLL